MMGKKQHRCSKVKREERRIAHAVTWADGFEVGYIAGYEQGQKDLISSGTMVKIPMRKAVLGEYETR